ncbi:MAG: hypothetical protein ABL916_24600 [Burkholderiaceae bacterium]
MHDIPLPHRPAQPGPNEFAMQGGLLTLAFQDALLFTALMAGVAPHPPAAVGPFIGALMALALRAAWGLRQPGRSGHGLALGVALLHLANFGPHKFFTEQGPLIAPMVAVGLALIVQTAWLAGRCLWLGRARQTLPRLHAAPGRP